MNQTTNKSPLQLHEKAFFRIEGIDAGSTVLCEQGILWLTQANDIHDYMLQPGEKMVINKKSNLLIEALSDARMSILHSN